MWLRRIFLSVTLGLICFLMSGVSALACKAPDAEGSNIVVAYRDARPFTYQSETGQPRGFSVDLWRSVAAEIGRNTDFVFCETIHDQETALKSGTIDVSISPFTITAARLGEYDFSQQYLSSGLTLATRQQRHIDFSAAFGVISDMVLHPSTLRNVGLFIALNLLIAIAFRAVFRRSSSQTRNRVRGYGFETLEAVTRTMGLKGVTQELPSLSGRLFELSLALTGTVLSGTIFGVITTALVHTASERSAVLANELVTMDIATLKCSTAQTFLKDQYRVALDSQSSDTETRQALAAHMRALNCDGRTETLSHLSRPDPSSQHGAVHLTATWEAAMSLLRTGQVDAVLGDWASLTYISRTPLYDGKVWVQPNVYRNEPFGWAITTAQDTSELRRGINRALIARMRQTDWRKGIENALGAGSIAPH